MRRIEAVEKDLKALSDASASKEDISRVRSEMKKLYDGLHVGMPKERRQHLGFIHLFTLEFLDLHSYVWGIRTSSVYIYEYSPSNIYIYLQNKMYML